MWKLQSFGVDWKMSSRTFDTKAEAEKYARQIIRRKVLKEDIAKGKF